MLAARSLQLLERCDDRLRQLVLAIADRWPCDVVQGARTELEEQAAIIGGKSKLKSPRDSKHVIWDGRPRSLAVDLVPLPLDWNDTKRFYAFGGYALGQADRLGIRIRWGGDWNSNRLMNDQTFNDLDHFELVE